MPLRTARAWRRKLSTLTPGISSGCWKPRKMPRAARSSVGSLVMSSPLNRIVPLVTSYAGLARRALARVDFPEPLGPISTWTSDSGTVRLIPRRISWSSTATWRSSSSSSGSVDMASDSITTTAVVEILALSRFWRRRSPEWRLQRRQNRGGRLRGGGWLVEPGVDVGDGLLGGTGEVAELAGGLLAADGGVGLERVQRLRGEHRLGAGALRPPQPGGRGELGDRHRDREPGGADFPVTFAASLASVANDARLPGSR